ncbi:MAG TPA: TIGR03936 family radical SAM-associated protein [Candidatus Dormibacteraeota bacterium]|nr:TIGR03936 family radical SAM-associated protein [Candidatus Dormibacteraeota bacterium]
MPDVAQRWRLVYRRGPAAAATAQRAELEAWEVTFAASGLPLLASGGAQPRPRLAMPPPLPTGLTGDAELLEFQLHDRRPAPVVRAALAEVLPWDHAIVDLFDVWAGLPPLPALVVAMDYTVDLAAARPLERLEGAIAALLAAPRLERTRQRGDRATTRDLRPFILALAAETDGSARPDAGVVTKVGEPADDRVALRMRLAVHPEQGTARPDDVVAALADGAGMPLSIAGGSRTRVWTRDEPEAVGPV